MALIAVVLVGVFLVGLAITGFGLISLRQWFRLYRRSAADLHRVVEGPTELVGTATPLDAYGTVRSGLTGEECLLFENVVEEYDDSGQGGGSWTELASGGEGVPFLVDDGTGRVLVDPDGSITVLKRAFEERLEPGADPSGTVTSFLDRSGLDREHNTVDIGITELTYGDDQRFREHRIHAGETVYVAGEADRQVGDYEVGFGGPDAVVRADRTRSRLRKYLDYPFVISDRSETIAERWLLTRSAKILLVGIPIVLVAGYLLAVGFH